MTFRFSAVILATGIFGWFSTLAHSSFDDSTKRIHAVENGLKKGIQLKDSESPGMNIFERMKFYNVPGISIAIIHNGKIEWAKTYNQSPNETITTNTLFQAASISKPVAAALALSVVQKNKINLDQNVNELLHTWKINENQYTTKEKVTLRRLLSHTAGLSVHGFEGYSSIAALPTITQILNGEKPANSDPVVVNNFPGKEFSYSGGGYIVAQQLIEDVTKKKFSDLARKLIFNPLEMNDSGYELIWPNSKNVSIANGHLADGSMLPGNWNMYPESAAAGLWTTPSDLARFVIEIQNAYLGQSNKILSGEIVKQMLTSQSSKHYGLGFGVKPLNGNVLEFAHNGSNVGYKGGLVGFAQLGLGAVIMTNSDNGLAIIPEIIRSIADVYRWPNGYSNQSKIVEAIHIDPAIYKKLAGHYVIKAAPEDPVIDLILTTKNNEFFITLPYPSPISETKTFSLTPESESVFFTTDGDFEITFTPGNDDEFTLMGMKAKRI